MQGLDYRTIVGTPGSEADAYVLDLGSMELEPISLATLLSLRERTAVVREALDGCFVDRPVLWVDPEALDEASCGDQFGEIAASLSEFDRRFKQCDGPADAVLARIVELWRALTLELLGRLESRAGVELGASTKVVLADYRRSAFACVEALLQLLPEEDRCSIDTRERLELGRARLARFLHVAPEHLGEARWRTTEAPAGIEDPAFVTWGIP